MTIEDLIIIEDMGYEVPFEVWIEAADLEEEEA